MRKDQIQSNERYGDKSRDIFNEQGFMENQRIIRYSFYKRTELERENQAYKTRAGT